MKSVVCKFIVIITIIAEIVFCFMFFISTNTEQYASWVEEQVTVSDVVVTGHGASYRSNMSSLNSVSVKYNDDIVILDLYNYNFKYRRNDIITVRYNPDNTGEIIYQPYEDYCVKKKRIKIVLFFAIIIFVTIFFYRIKMEKE